MSMKKRKYILAVGLCAFVLAAPMGARAEKVEGSISVKNVKEESYPAMARASLADALAVAQQQMKDSKPVEAELTEKDNFLVYQVKLVNKENKVGMVVLDAGNLTVLKSKEKNETFDD
jgi:uncharacterized membrane protein YkoI